MTTDLTMLVASAVLAVLYPFLYSAVRVLTGSFSWVEGNRETPPPHDQRWIGRTVRTHQNLLESLAPFAILVRVAHVTGRANEATALGATISFWARVAHTLCYMLGLIYIRTAFWIVSVGGMAVILVQLS